MGTGSNFRIDNVLPRFLGKGPSGVIASQATLPCNGLNITGWLYRAGESDREPGHPIDFPAPKGGALIVGHGGVGGVPIHYDVVLRRMAKAGWTIGVPSFRGESGSDGQIEFGLGEVEDTLAWAEAVGKLDRVDPKKIVALGSSHGAAVCIQALGHSGQPFACGIGVAGVYNIEKWLDWLKDMDHEALGDRIISRMLAMDTIEWENRSASRLASSIKVPVMLLHGDRDSIVPLEQTTEFSALLEKFGDKETVVFISPGSEHEFIWAPERADARSGWAAIMEFINRNIV